MEGVLAQFAVELGCDGHRSELVGSVGLCGVGFGAACPWGGKEAKVVDVVGDIVLDGAGLVAKMLS